MQFVEEAILTVNYMEINLTKKIDLDMIAQVIHYSKYHLHRVPSCTVGLTIYGHIQRKQLTKTGKLLVFSEKSIVEIAFLSGYQSQQAFTNAFTSMYKIPPNRYEEKEKSYPLQLKSELDGRYDMLKRPKNRAWDIRYATREDIPAWMRLIRLVIDSSPNLQEDTYMEVLRQRIRTNQALIVKDGVTTMGILLFPWDTGSIDFMGCHPLYKKVGVPGAFLDEVIGELLTGQEISIATSREGDEADNGQRREIQELGFAEAEPLEEYGYSIQRFVFSQEV